MAVKLENETIDSPRPNLLKPALFLLVLILVIFIASQKLLNKTEIQTETKSDLSQKGKEAKGSLTLVSDEDKTSYNSGEKMILIVEADTKSHPISAFDIVLNYDNNFVNYVSAKSLVGDFQIVSVNRNNKVTITGFKKGGAKGPVAFDKARIVEVVFSAKGAGKADFSLSFVPGRTTTSNLVDEAGMQRLGKVKGFNALVK